LPLTGISPAKPRIPVSCNQQIDEAHGKEVAMQTR
jgi:hypothetical protein